MGLFFFSRPNITVSLGSLLFSKKFERWHIICFWHCRFIWIAYILEIQDTHETNLLLYQWIEGGGGGYEIYQDSPKGIPLHPTQFTWTHGWPWVELGVKGHRDLVLLICDLQICSRGTHLLTDWISLVRGRRSRSQDHLSGLSSTFDQLSRELNNGEVRFQSSKVKVVLTLYESRGGNSDVEIGRRKLQWLGEASSTFGFGFLGTEAVSTTLSA